MITTNIYVVFNIQQAVFQILKLFYVKCVGLSA